jgi:hypothetical protein
MFLLITGCLLASAVWCGSGWYFAKKKWIPRMEGLERNLQSVSEAMVQMADIQMKTHQKVTGNLGEIEERIFELSIPSHDGKVPLEQRRRVAALAQQGTPMEEILKRVNLPRGEAELILSLQRCKEAASSRGRHTPGQSRVYAEA